jgi:hypothetical protein
LLKNKWNLQSGARVSVKLLDGRVKRGTYLHHTIKGLCDDVVLDEAHNEFKTWDEAQKIQGCWSSRAQEAYKSEATKLGLTADPNHAVCMNDCEIISFSIPMPLKEENEMIDITTLQIGDEVAFKRGSKTYQGTVVREKMNGHSPIVWCPKKYSWTDPADAFSASDTIMHYAKTLGLTKGGYTGIDKDNFMKRISKTKFVKPTLQELTVGDRVSFHNDYLDEIITGTIVHHDDDETLVAVDDKYRSDFVDVSSYEIGFIDLQEDYTVADQKTICHNSRNYGHKIAECHIARLTKDDATDFLIAKLPPAQPVANPPPDIFDLNPGDKFEAKIAREAGNKTVQKTVSATWLGNNRAWLDVDLPSTWHAKELDDSDEDAYDLAVKLGFDTSQERAWTMEIGDDFEITKILERATNLVKESMNGDYAKNKAAVDELNIGDVILLADGKTKGTVVLDAETGEHGVVICLNATSSYDSWLLDYSHSVDDTENKLINYFTTRLGIDMTGKAFYHVLPSEFGKLVSSNPLHKFDTNNLGVGDKIKFVCHGELGEGVVVDCDGTKIIAVEDKSRWEDHAVVLDDDEYFTEDKSKKIERTLRKYGMLDRQLLAMEEDDDCITFLECVGSVKPVKNVEPTCDDLGVGDEVELKIANKYGTRWKTVKAKYVGQCDDSENGCFYLLQNVPSTYIMDTVDEWMDSKGLETACENAKKLGLDTNLRRAWESLHDDTKIIKITKVATATQQKETTMANESKSTFEQLKDDASEAAYRITAKKMTEGVRAGLLMAIATKGGGNDKAAAIGAALETEYGEGFIGYLLGQGLQHIPGIKDDPRAPRLAREFRVGGMSTAGEALVSQAMEFILPAIKEAMKNLPELPATTTTNVRVPAQQTKRDEHHETSNTNRQMGAS